MGLENDKGSTPNYCLKDNHNLCFDTKSKMEIFKNFYSGLADALLQKLPCPSKRFGIYSVISYYQSRNIGTTTFSLQRVSEEDVFIILRDTDNTKSPGIDGISGIFLKDGAEILRKPIAQLCNYSISSSAFPTKCKIAKLKPIYKKRF